MPFGFCFVFVLFLVCCSPAPVLGIGLLLALEGELPLLAAGPWEDPALGDDVAELGGVHEAHHAVAGNEGEAIGVKPLLNHSTAMAQSPALTAVLCDSSRWSKATRARTKGRRAGTQSSEEQKKAQAKDDAAGAAAPPTAEM